MSKLFFLAVALLLAVGVFIATYTRIDAGNEGVVVKRYTQERGVQDVSLRTGTFYINPLVEYVEEFPVHMRPFKFEEFQITASDGTDFTGQLSGSYRVAPGHSPAIFAEYRKGLDEIEATGQIEAIFVGAYRDVALGFTPDSLMSHRAAFNAAAKDTLQRRLRRKGFDVGPYTGSLTPPPSIVETATKKNKEIQQTLFIENQNRTARAEAEKAQTVAQGYANALAIRSKAEADANRRIAESLTPSLVKYRVGLLWKGDVINGRAPQIIELQNGD